MPNPLSILRTIRNDNTSKPQEMKEAKWGYHMDDMHLFQYQLTSFFRHHKNITKNSAMQKKCVNFPHSSELRDNKNFFL